MVCPTSFVRRYPGTPVDILYFTLWNFVFNKMFSHFSLIKCVCVRVMCFVAKVSPSKRQLFSSYFHNFVLFCLPVLAIFDIFYLSICVILHVNVSSVCRVCSSHTTMIRSIHMSTAVKAYMVNFHICITKSQNLFPWQFLSLVKKHVD